MPLSLCPVRVLTLPSLAWYPCSMHANYRVAKRRKRELDRIDHVLAETIVRYAIDNPDALPYQKEQDRLHYFESTGQYEQLRGVSRILNVRWSFVWNSRHSATVTIYDHAPGTVPGFIKYVYTALSDSIRNLRVSSITPSYDYPSGSITSVILSDSLDRPTVYRGLPQFHQCGEGECRYWDKRPPMHSRKVKRNVFNVFTR